MTGHAPSSLSEEDRRELSHMPFLRELRHVELPSCALPRIPARLCMRDGHPFYCMPGPMHVLKNVGAQAASACRILYYGKYFTDTSGLLRNGLPVPAYTRHDPMSDRLAALMASPFFLPATLAAWQALVRHAGIGSRCISHVQTGTVFGLLIPADTC